MPGRWPWPVPKLSGRPWSAKVGDDIERWMHRLVKGMSNLQRTPDLPTEIRAGVASNRGTGPAVANDDHVHKILTAVPAAITLGAVGAEGTSSALARADHVHDTVGLEAEIDAKIAVVAASGGGWARHFMMLGSDG